MQRLPVFDFLRLLIVDVLGNEFDEPRVGRGHDNVVGPEPQFKVKLLKNVIDNFDELHCEGFLPQVVTTLYYVRSDL